MREGSIAYRVAARAAGLDKDHPGAQPRVRVCRRQIETVSSKL
mgnify:CR=1